MDFVCGLCIARIPVGQVGAIRNDVCTGSDGVLRTISAPLECGLESMSAQRKRDECACWCKVPTEATIAPAESVTAHETST